MKKTLLLAAFVGMVAANAQAIDVTPYVGADLGYSSLDLDSGTGVSSKSLSVSGVVGAKVEQFGLEAFYNHGFREHKATVNTRLTSVGVDALYYVPLGCECEYELIGAVGYGQYKVKGYGYGSDTGYALRLGAGVEYHVDENVSVRAMYHHGFVNSSILNDTDEVSVGVRYYF